MTDAGKRVFIGESVAAFAVALGAGAVALISPPAALLILALLGARALQRAERPCSQWASISGPILAVLTVGALVDLSAAIGVLFIWRLYADTRWSAREETRLAAAAGRPGEATPAALAHIWLTPLFGLAIVAYTAPHMVAGLPLDLPHVPAWVPIGVGALAAAAFFDWVLRRAADWRLGELTPAPSVHALAHHAVFALGFGLMLDVSAGLVALIAWRLAHAAPFAMPAKAQAL